MKRFCVLFIAFICQIFISCLVLDTVNDKKMAVLKGYKNDENITALPAIFWDKKSEVYNGFAYSGVCYGTLELIPAASAADVYKLYKSGGVGKGIPLDTCFFYLGSGGDVTQIYLVSTGKSSKNDYNRYVNYKSWYGIDVIEKDYVCWGDTVITNFGNDHIEVWLPKEWFETFAYAEFE